MRFSTRFTCARISCLLGMAIAVAVSAFGLARFEAVHCRAHELGNITQAIVSTWQGEPFRCTINLSQGLPLSYLGNHFSPVMAVLAPLVGPSGDGRILIVVQALGIGLCIPLAYRFASRRLAPRTSLLLAGLLFLHPALWLSGLCDVHPETFAMPLLLLSIHLVQEGRLTQAALATVTASLLAESLALVTAVYWLVVASSSDHRRRAFLLGCAHLALFVLIMQSAIPHFARSAAHPYFRWRYAHLGTDLTSVLLSPLRRPGVVLAFLLRPANLLTALALVAPMGMLPLLSIELLLAPGAALGAIALASTGVLDIGFGQVAVALPYVFAATVFGLERLARSRDRVLVAGSLKPGLGSLLVLNGIVWHGLCHSALPGVYPPLSPLADWGYYRAGASRPAIDRLGALVPASATLCAQQNLVAVLGFRRDVYVFPYGVDLANHILLDFTHPYGGLRAAGRTMLLWGLWAPEGLDWWLAAVTRVMGDPAWGVERIDGTAVLFRRGASRASMDRVRALVERASRDWRALADP